MNDAYTHGQNAAGTKFGLKAASARLVGTAVGAGLGALLAPEGEGMQGAVMGGLGGYGVGAAASRGAQALGRGVSAVMPRRPAAPPAAPTSPPPSPAAPPPSSVMSVPQPDPFGTTPIDPGAVGVPTQNARLKGIQKAAADFGVSLRVPHTPVSVGYSPEDVLLPGMHKWVPRELIERTHAHLDNGFDDQAVLESELSRGQYRDPAIAAGLGAALARYGLPKSGPMGAALGGLLGAGIGATYHKATEPSRRRNTLEALHGVHRMRSFEGQRHSTAREAIPLVVGRGEGGRV